MSRLPVPFCSELNLQIFNIMSSRYKINWFELSTESESTFPSMSLHVVPPLLNLKIFLVHHSELIHYPSYDLLYIFDFSLIRFCTAYNHYPSIYQFHSFKLSVNLLKFPDNTSWQKESWDNWHKTLLNVYFYYYIFLCSFKHLVLQNILKYGRRLFLCSRAVVHYAM